MNGLFAYIIVCIVWGSTYLAIRIGVKDMDPFFFAGIRFLIAGLLIVSFSYLRKMKFPKKINVILKHGVVGLFMLLGGNGLVVLAEKNIDSGVASLILATMPIFIVIIEGLIYRSVKITKWGIFGLVFGAFGVYMLVMPSSTGITYDLYSVIILIIATFLWSFGSVYSKRIEKSGSIFPTIGIQMLFGSVGLLITSLILKENMSFELTKASYFSIAYLIIFGSIIGYSSYIYLLSKWPATKAGTYAYINPIVAILLGNIILDEKISITMILSMTIILTGVIIVNKSRITNK
jgi:drug/metabolite transporter (DMT)-like permease